MSYNKVITVGRLTRDPELTFTTSGKPICKIGVAVSRKWKQDNQPKEETTFIDMTAFGSAAENIGKFFTKGRLIMIEGRLKMEEWTDKQTQQKRSKLGVVIENFVFVGSNKEDNEQSAAAPLAVEPPPVAQPGTEVAPDDLPF